VLSNSCGPAYRDRSRFGSGQKVLVAGFKGASSGYSFDAPARWPVECVPRGRNLFLVIDDTAALQ